MSDPLATEDQLTASAALRLLASLPPAHRALVATAEPARTPADRREDHLLHILDWLALVFARYPTDTAATALELTPGAAGLRLHVAFSGRAPDAADTATAAHVVRFVHAVLWRQAAAADARAAIRTDFEAAYALLAASCAPAFTHRLAAVSALLGAEALARLDALIDAWAAQCADTGVPFDASGALATLAQREALDHVEQPAEVLRLLLRRLAAGADDEPDALLRVKKTILRSELLQKCDFFQAYVSGSPSASANNDNNSGDAEEGKADGQEEGRGEIQTGAGEAHITDAGTDAWACALTDDDAAHAGALRAALACIDEYHAGAARFIQKGLRLFRRVLGQELVPARANSGDDGDGPVQLHVAFAEPPAPTPLSFVWPEPPAAWARASALRWHVLHGAPTADEAHALSTACGALWEPGVVQPLVLDALLALESALAAQGTDVLGATLGLSAPPSLATDLYLRIARVDAASTRRLARSTGLPGQLGGRGGIDVAWALPPLTHVYEHDRARRQVVRALERLAASALHVVLRGALGALFAGHDHDSGCEGDASDSDSASTESDNWWEFGEYEREMLRNLIVYNSPPGEDGAHEEDEPQLEAAGEGEGEGGACA
ncbi:hypothetical protein BD414DRAFT_579443 [Trametes punicea]|nr:hypothetical protein BD414DRAFT_579443 [Trametes punicea]